MLYNVLERTIYMENNKRVTIHQIFWYFVLFSILGLAIETFYGFITMGIIESRKGLIWGPFCPVYGVGGVFLIILLNKIDRKNYFKLFIYGFIIGSAIEYILSYLLEAIYGVRFWDYTYTEKDINGRICVLYSLFWGILSIFLMSFIKPKIDKLINKISKNIKGSVEIGLAIFLLIDAFVTVWAINTYEDRVLKAYYNEQIISCDSVGFIPNIINKIENEYFTNERMKTTFPNLRVEIKDGSQVLLRDIIQ